jgi:ABC-type branched-subunit amino acid transport system substrate-binding protein
MKKKLLFKVLLLFLAGSVFAGFAVAQAEKLEPIKIATTCSLTGVYAVVVGQCYGEKDYYTYLNEFQNGVNGHPIEVTMYAGGETPKELSSYRAFRENAHSIYIYSTTANRALSKEINEIDKIPNFTGSMDERIIKPYTFIVGPSYQKIFEVSFRKMVSLGGKTVIIGHGDHEWMVSIPQDVIEKGIPEKAGIKVVELVEHQTTSPNITPEIARMKRANPDYIWIWGDAISTIQAALSLRIPPEKLFVSHWFTIPVLTDKFGKKIDGMRGWLALPTVDMILRYPDLRMAKEWKEFFSKHKPYTRNWLYTRGWLVATLRVEGIKRALEKTGNVIPKDIYKFRKMIRDELENLKGFDLGIGHNWESVDYSDHMGWQGLMPAIVKDGKWAYEEYQVFD